MAFVESFKQQVHWTYLSITQKCKEYEVNRQAGRGEHLSVKLEKLALSRALFYWQENYYLVIQQSFVERRNQCKKKAK